MLPQHKDGETWREVVGFATIGSCHSSYWLILGTAAILSSGLCSTFVPCLLHRTRRSKGARGGHLHRAGQGLPRQLVGVRQMQFRGL